MFIHLVIQPVSIYYEPGTVLCGQNTAGNKTNLGPVHKEYTLWQLFLQWLLFESSYLVLLILNFHLAPAAVENATEQ